MPKLGDKFKARYRELQKPRELPRLLRLTVNHHDNMQPALAEALKRAHESAYPMEQDAAVALPGHAVIEEPAAEDFPALLEQVNAIIRSDQTDREKAEAIDKKLVNYFSKSLEQAEVMNKKQKGELSDAAISVMPKIDQRISYFQHMRESALNYYDLSFEHRNTLSASIDREIAQLTQLIENIDGYVNKLGVRIASIEEKIVAAKEELAKKPDDEKIKARLEQLEQRKAQLTAAKDAAPNVSANPPKTDREKDIASRKAAIEKRLAHLRECKSELENLEPIDNPENLRKPLEDIEEKFEKNPLNTENALAVFAPLQALRDQLFLPLSYNSEEKEPSTLPAIKPEDFGREAFDNPSIKELCSIVERVNKQLEILAEYEQLIANDPEHLKMFAQDVAAHQQQLDQEIKSLSKHLDDNKDPHYRKILATHDKIEALTTGANALAGALNDKEHPHIAPVDPIAHKDRSGKQPVGQAYWYEKKEAGTNLLGHPKFEYVKREMPQASRQEHLSVIAKMNSQLQSQGNDARVRLVNTKHGFKIQTYNSTGGAGVIRNKQTGQSRVDTDATMQQYQKMLAEDLPKMRSQAPDPLERPSAEAEIRVGSPTA